MGKFDGVQYLGVRQKDNDKLVAVYMGELSGDDKEKEKKVIDWYYMQDCSTSEHIEDYYVDTLTDREIQSLNSK